VAAFVVAGAGVEEAAFVVTGAELRSAGETGACSTAAGCAGVCGGGAVVCTGGDEVGVDCSGEGDMTGGGDGAG